jgi:hypothetical protein
MAFTYLGSGGSINLFNLIFNQILKISPTLLYKYTTLQDQVFHLILLPHVILFIFLFGFGWGVIPENKGLRYLVMIVTYIYVVMQGWYGTFLVPLLEVWFWITLVFGIFIFFMFRLIHPSTAQRLGGAAAKTALDVGKRMGKDKQIERLAEELTSVQRQMRTHYPHIRDNPGAAQVYAQLEEHEFELKRKIKELEG